MHINTSQEHSFDNIRIHIVNKTFCCKLWCFLYLSFVKNDQWLLGSSGANEKNLGGGSFATKIKASKLIGS